MKQEKKIGPTVGGRSVDSAWEQRKLEVRKMLVNRTESPAARLEPVEGSSTCFVKLPSSWLDSKNHRAQ